jgi:hypothetical protein
VLKTVLLYRLVEASALEDAETAHEQNLPGRDFHDMVHVFVIPAATIEIVDMYFIVDIQLELLE